MGVVISHMAVTGSNQNLKRAATKSPSRQCGTRHRQPRLGSNAVSVRVHGKGNLGAKKKGEAIAEILFSIKRSKRDLSATDKIAAASFLFTEKIPVYDGPIRLKFA